MNGIGKCKFANGDVYDGHWKDHKINGNGILRKQSGEIYNGDWSNGNRSGCGT